MSIFKRNKKMNKSKKNKHLINNKTRKNKILKDKIVGEIRFYDNQDDIIKQFQKSKKYIHSIKVSNSPNIEVLYGDKKASLYTNKFLELYPNNKYALYLKENCYKEVGTDIGITYSDINDLIKWSNNTNIQKKVAIFDWDGTISIIEGIIIPSTRDIDEDLKEYQVTISDIALYYAGTLNRLNKLREMFNHLDKKNVEVYILTNNPIATCNWQKHQKYGIGPKSKLNFLKIVKEFITQIKEENILCGFDTNNFKPDTFFNNEYLRHLYYEIQKSHITSQSSVI